MEARHSWIRRWIRTPQPNDRFHTDECCISFNTPKSPGGLYVDTMTYLAFGKNYVYWNYIKTEHPVYLHIVETKKSVSEGGSNDTDPEYERNYELVILPGHVTIPLSSQELPETVRSAIDFVISSTLPLPGMLPETVEMAINAVRTDDVGVICEHVMNLKQLDNGVMIPPSGWKCEMCNKTENLWLNLTDGSIHCSSTTSLNDCTVQHFIMTDYPLSVNLESITDETKVAGVYCFECSDTLDPLLAQHLQHFGIDYSSLHKVRSAIDFVISSAPTLPGMLLPGLLPETVEMVTNAVQTDDEDFICEHAMNLQQLDNGVMIPPSGWECEMCNNTKNLWLNLTDGSIHCGSIPSLDDDCTLSHYHMTNYPLFVNLESITDETAEVYCFECSDTLDPLLAQHLQHFGIDYSSLHKTGPVTVEKERIQYTNFDTKCIKDGVEEVQLLSGQGYSYTDSEAGPSTVEKERIQVTKCIKEGVEEVQLLSGQGYTGIINLGNSSYLSAIVQVVFSIISFRSRYYFKQTLNAAFAASPIDPTLDLNLQLIKLANGLMSGQYSVPSAKKGKGKQTETITVKQDGISPGMFKSLIVGSHPQFLKSCEEDASEFFLHFVDQVKKIHVLNRNTDPTICFKFCIEDRYEGPSGKVSYSQRSAYVLSVAIPMHEAVNNSEYSPVDIPNRYAPGRSSDCAVRPVVPLMRCLDCFTAPEESHDDASTSSNIKATRIKTAGLASFPDFLAIQLQKFVQKEDWDPVKLDVCVDVPERIDITRMRSKVHLPGEELLLSPAKEATVLQLVQMQFPELLCRKAVMNASNDGIQAAADWLLEHQSDMDIDDPITVEDDLLDGDGIYRLFGIVSHTGETLHTGHYVAYVHQKDKWMIFDDEHVEVVENPPMDTGYMYFFRRSE